MKSSKPVSIIIWIYIILLIITAIGIYSEYNNSAFTMMIICAGFPFAGILYGIAIIIENQNKTSEQLSFMIDKIEDLSEENDDE